MANYKESLRSDVIEQFKDKPNVLALCDTIGKQMNDIYTFFNQLTQRYDIDRLSGNMLDAIGDIVGLTRADAKLMKRDEEITDDVYRNLLKWKISYNTSGGTYDDVTNSFKLFVDTSMMKYSETPTKPATMTYTVTADGDNVLTLSKAKHIKPAGVKMKIDVTYPIKDMTLYVGNAVLRSMWISTSATQ